MYFPYIRGRQYDLLALRELILNDKMGDKIIPIIEPVKITSTFTSTIKAFIDKGHDIALILNPEVGSFISDVKFYQNITDDIDYVKYILKEYNSSHVIKSVIMNNLASSFVNFCVENEVDKSELLVVNSSQDYLDTYEEKFSRVTPRYVLIPDGGMFRRRIKSNRVILDDKFKKQVKNSDYSSCVDEFFSDDHLYYESEDYIGFSDYSIVGKSYNEVGFAPYSVAIHIVYFDSKKNLRVRHFVSKTNEDIYNTAGKFYEALSDLNIWCKQNPEFFVNTIGLGTLLEHYENGTYPGLGTVKKLSLMHHLELMNNNFSGVK